MIQNICIPVCVLLWVDELRQREREHGSDNTPLDISTKPATRPRHLTATAVLHILDNILQFRVSLPFLAGSATYEQVHCRR